MKKIPIKYKDTKFFALVDDEDYEEMMKYKWYTYLRKDKPSYAVTSIKGKQIFMHRLIAKTPEGMLTDHINQDKLDNRRENLRHCTHAENMRNVSSWRTNTSGHKGVAWNKKDKRWIAYVVYNGRNIHLGEFIEKEDAIKARQDSVKKYHKEFVPIS